LSQSLSYDLWSSIPDLENAKELIEQAIQLKPYEKLFQSQKGIIKLLNLENHNEAYVEHAQYVMKRIKEKSEWNEMQIRQILEREKEIELVEERFIAEGKISMSQSSADESSKVPVDSLNEKEMERDIARLMEAKYYKAIEFYQDLKDAKQVTLAKEELQRLSKTFQEIEYLYRLDFSKASEDLLIQAMLKEIPIDLSSSKVLHRIERIKIEKAKEIFQNENYNFEVLEWAMKDYFKLKEEVLDRAA